MHFANLADRAGVQHLLRFHIHAAVALLEAKSDVDPAVRAIGRPHHPLAARHIQSGRLLHINVFTGFHRSLKMLRMQIDRRRNHDGVDFIRSEQILKVLVSLGLRRADLRLRLGHLLFHYVTDRHHLCARILGQDGGGVSSPASRANQSHAHRAILGASAHRL